MIAALTDVVARYPRWGFSPEVEYDPRLIRVPGAPEVIKNRYSAFTGTSLDKILRQNEVDTVVVCGFMTNFCCDSTAREAHDRDYFVDFIVDATGTPGTEHMSQVEVGGRRAHGEPLPRTVQEPDRRRPTG